MRDNSRYPLIGTMILAILVVIFIVVYAPSWPKSAGIAGPAVVVPLTEGGPPLRLEHFGQEGHNNGVTCYWFDGHAESLTCVP